MSGKKRKNKVLIPIIAGIAGLAIIFFTFLYLLTYGNISSIFSHNTQEQPEELAATQIPQPTQTPAPTPSPTPTPTPEPLPPEFTSYRPRLTGADYITVEMNPKDIGNGYLILVNPDTYYEIPDNLGLVSVTENRTSSYRVNSVSQRLQKTIIPHLNDMMDAFYEETGRNYIYIISTYRDYSSQRNVYNQYINQPGRAARPGHSEHHTGLALDFATLVDGVQYPFVNFDAARNWCSANSYKYGFILRYPGNKTSITKVISEPWHYRYIGLPHSYILYSKNWVLEEYMEEIRKYTAQEPYITEYGGKTYEIFFTENMQITVPVHAKYEISGNNIDGFIVTIYDRYDRLTNISIE